MATHHAARTGGQILVDQLVKQGADHVFCVPGESYLAVLDALHDATINVTVCRQEGGAAMMAEAHGKLTGRPGICMVTRGPGATNASPGIHIAEQDSTPMILFVGQIDRSMRGRGAFQEVDYSAFFGSMTKWAAEIDSAARIPEMVARAYAVAMNGRPGPVVLALPEDMLVEMASVADAPRVDPVEVAPTPSALARFEQMVKGAKRPFLLLGGTRWSAEAVASVQHVAERWGLPVACQFRRQMLFDHTHPNYAGDLGLGVNPKLVERIKASDCLILLGGRLGEIASQSYTLLDIPHPRQNFIHIHAGAEELGRVYQPTLAINATPQEFVAAFAALTPPKSPDTGEAKAAHAAYRAWSTPPNGTPGAVQMGAIMDHLNAVLPADAILCNGAGNYATWLHRFYRFRHYATQLAPTCGSMGYGTPAAVGAKRVFEHRTVVAFAGDGCFMMNGQELATAVQYELPVIVLVIDNGMYGTIRMHQEREYPGRVSATALKNPDFAALARSYGAHGETVRKTEDFAGAFNRAQESGKPALIHILLDPEAISPSTTLSAIREKALAQKG